MTVNVENINLMIEAISKETNPIYMNSFVERNNPACGTTACLAGWANILRLGEKGKGRDADWRFEDTDRAAEWMGINDAQASRLFYCGSVDYRLDPEQRKAATITLLTKLRDEGDASWKDVLPA